MDRFLRSVGSRVKSPPFLNQDAVPTDPTGPTVTISDSAGTAIVTAGVATPVTGEPGVVSYTINAAQLDTYKAVWTGTVAGSPATLTSYFEIVGGHYFGIGELRDFDPAITPGAYSDQKVINAREKAEEFIEMKTLKSWVPRGARVTLNGTGRQDIALDYNYIPIRRLVEASITAGGATDTFDSTELADVSITDTGFLIRKTLGVWSSGHRNVSLLYEYGANQPDEGIKEAALLLAQARLIPTDIQSGVKQLSVEGYSLTYRDGLISSVPGVHELLEPYVQSYVAFA